jgi:GT2 family glycosyltransferase
MVAGREELVSVLLTTFNSAGTLAACLESVRAQDYSPLELIVVDNASNDATRELLRGVPSSTRVIFNPRNIGFAAAQNQAMQKARGEWLLCLNPDVVLKPDFISTLLRAAQHDIKVGSVCGKLLRWRPGTATEKTKVIDSTGMYFRRNLRHLDRGADQLDAGQYDEMQYVFGATGAAALYRQAMVQDVSVDGQFFDEEFFAYREDADLAWRAQLLGWGCLYVPKAVGWHQRLVTPERRGQLPLLINWHSVKNRFLMRAKNISWPLYLRLFVPFTWRDLMVVGYALTRDWRLISALLYPLRHWGALMRKRNLIQGKRRVGDDELLRWFSDQPRAENTEQGESSVSSQLSARKA